jgi:hypothetical protein
MSFKYCVCVVRVESRGVHAPSSHARRASSGSVQGASPVAEVEGRRLDLQPAPFPSLVGRYGGAITSRYNCTGSGAGRGRWC